MHKLRRLIQPGGVLAHRYSAVSLSPPGYLDAWAACIFARLLQPSFGCQHRVGFLRSAPTCRYGKRRIDARAAAAGPYGRQECQSHGV